MRKAPTNYTAASIRVCVDRAENRQINGLLYSRQLSHPLPFTDLSNLLLQMEEVLDYQCFPVAYQRKRSFDDRKRPPAGLSDEDGEPLDAATVEDAHGAVTTFVIYVLSRQNTTWQGEIDWLDGQPRQPFSSALELIRLTDKVIFGG